MAEKANDGDEARRAEGHCQLAVGRVRQEGDKLVLIVKANCEGWRKGGGRGGGGGTKM